jgi:hypothetical protein
LDFDSEPVAAVVNAHVVEAVPPFENSSLALPPPAATVSVIKQDGSAVTAWLAPSTAMLVGEGLHPEIATLPWFGAPAGPAVSVTFSVTVRLSVRYMLQFSAESVPPLQVLSRVP